MIVLRKTVRPLLEAWIVLGPLREAWIVITREILCL